MRLFLLLLPWLELFTLIELGTRTSTLTVLLYVLATLLLGMAIVRSQWRVMFERLRQAQDMRVAGPELLLDDMAASFAGLLLMIPGLITDCLAVLLLVGPLRRRLAAALRGDAGPGHPRFEGRGSGDGPGAGQPRRGDPPRTIEGSFHRVDDD